MAERAGPKFTIVQLLVVVAIVVFGSIWVLGLRQHHGEPAYKIKCSSNLRQIWLAMKMYSSNERDGSFPRTRYDPATADRPTAWTNPNAANPFADNGPLANDVTAAVFLIPRTQEITTDVFICPGPSVTAERMPLKDVGDIRHYSNFPSQAHLSYSFQNPYPTEAAAKAGFVWGDKLRDDFAIAADFNPGAAALTTVKFTDANKTQITINSPNHDYGGQNVLYADGHVEWYASAWAGVAQDNIYTFAKTDPLAQQPNPPAAPSGPPPESAGIVGSPVGPGDSVLLPARDPKVPLP